MRVKGEGSIYQQKDGAWIARLRYGMKPNGKPYEKKRRARTKTEAKKILDAMKQDVEQEDQRATKGYDNIKVEKYLDMFLDYKRADLSDTSYRRLASTINTHIKPEMKSLRMELELSILVQSVNPQNYAASNFSSRYLLYAAGGRPSGFDV